LPPKVDFASGIETCTASELPTLLQSLHSHSMQLFAGVDAPTLRAILGAEPDPADRPLARPIVFLSLSKLVSAEMLVSTAIDQIAGVASELWPFWYGGEDFSESGDNALSQMYLHTKLAALSSRLPALSVGWAESAIWQLMRARSPRVRRAAPEEEWSQLCYATSPTGLIIIATLDEMAPRRVMPLVHALEWLAAKADVAIGILCRNLPSHEAPFDRLLFRAHLVIASTAHSGRDENACGETQQPLELRQWPSVDLVLPPVYGRPHPQSPIEQRLFKMIADDAELAPKFIFNMRVEDVSLKSPTVDLLWPEGRLVIEFDGAEHRSQRTYREDRHRDFELVCAGYLVLRIANDEILEDFAKTIEKIRSFSRLRSSLKGETR
jgi:very-short-patch-repair endonuclease